MRNGYGAFSPSALWEGLSAGFCFSAFSRGLEFLPRKNLKPVLSEGMTNKFEMSLPYLCEAAERLRQSINAYIINK